MFLMTGITQLTKETLSTQGHLDLESKSHSRMTKSLGVLALLILAGLAAFWLLRYFYPSYPGAKIPGNPTAVSSSDNLE